MSTCGYVCPVCEGRGHDDEGHTCTYCSLESVKPTDKVTTIVSDEEWLQSVHFGPCCSHPDEASTKD